MKDEWTQVARQWKQFAAEVKKRRGELTDDELAEIDGDRKLLAGLI